ncbi:MAG: hypothetical protein E6Q97_09075 [Desulfurellales bacterium]|nr:MAG: hypothetical protein E6Q97_09075 [Desulfurellales bacterium]
MSNLTQRGPNANASARLPSLQAARAQDPNVQKALEALREWVEVRLGSRGDRFERAVTFRDLDSELNALRAELEEAIADASGSTSTATSTGTPDADLAAVQTTINALRSTVTALDGLVSSRIAAANAAIEVLTALVNTKGDFSSDTATSVDGEIVLFSGTAGKTGKRATGTGYAKVTAGVLSADSSAAVRADLQGDGAAVDQVGFRGVPLTSRSADYTLVLADAGKGTLHPASDANARTFTIPANASVAFPVGTAHTFVNETSQVVTIAITSDTLVLAGTTTTGSRSLAENGVATALKVTATKWIISGAGLT